MVRDRIDSQGFIQQKNHPLAMGPNQMISTLELRHIIESAFLPLSCTCRVNPDGYLSVQIFDRHSGRVGLFVTGISTAGLISSSAICNLVSQLRTELKAGRDSQFTPPVSIAS
jgi:hypothetical protein